MDDPFFTAGKRAHGAPWGQHSSYVEDIYRTYKPSSIPQRDNKAFQKALEFRAREKHEFEQLRAQRRVVLRFNSREGTYRFSLIDDRTIFQLKGRT